MKNLTKTQMQTIKGAPAPAPPKPEPNTTLPPRHDPNE